MPPARSRRGPDRDVPATPKTRSDAYTGILILALLAQIAGAIFLYLDYSQYPSAAPDIKTLPKPGDNVKSGAQPGAPGQPAPGPQPAPAPAPPPAPAPAPRPGGMGGGMP